MEETTFDNVFTICNIPLSIDIDKIKDLMAEYMEPRKKYYFYKDRSPYVEDEFSEYFTALASDGEEIGAGHYGMDVRTKNNEGIDVTCIIMERTISNEKSLIQNFKSSGANLDILFKEKKDEEAVNLFMDAYYNKLVNVKKEKNLDDLYILAYISTKRDIYIACFKINIDRIQFVKSGGFVESKKEDSVNINIDNFIDSTFGKVSLYKSKKRVELRLKNNILEHEFIRKIYSMT